MNDFKPLTLHPLPLSAGYFEPNQELPAQVKARSPAILVMTDLRQQVAFTVEPNVSIAWALDRMKTLGVRLLFVTNSDKEVLGLITSTDIQGEKPLQLHKALNLRHEEIMVRDRLDSTRSDAPLKQADDALYLDTTGLTSAEVVERLLALVRGDGNQGDGKPEASNPQDSKPEGSRPEGSRPPGEAL